MKKAPTAAERTGRHAARALAGLVWISWCVATAEPRPAPYGAGADHFSDSRDATRATRWSQVLEALQRLT